MLRVCLTVILRSILSLKNVFFLIFKKRYLTRKPFIAKENEDGCG